MNKGIEGLPGATKILVTLVAGSLFAGIVGWFMWVSLAASSSAAVQELFGAKIYLTPVSAAVLTTSLIAAEIYVVFRMGSFHNWAENLALTSLAGVAGLVSLIFAKSFFHAYFIEAETALMAILGFSVFLGLFIIFLVLIGECPVWVKNLVFLIFGATTGSLFSIVFNAETITILVSLMIFADISITSARYASRLVPARLAITTREWNIGLGDLIAYALVTTRTLVDFGLAFFLICVAFLCLGSLLTMRWAASSNYRPVPGLLLSGGLPLLFLLIGLSSRLI